MDMLLIPGENFSDNQSGKIPADMVYILGHRVRCWINTEVYQRLQVTLFRLDIDATNKQNLDIEDTRSKHSVTAVSVLSHLWLSIYQL